MKSDFVLIIVNKQCILRGEEKQCVPKRALHRYFMPGELETLLTGCYVELSMMPLSFKEFCIGLSQESSSATLDEKFNRYILTGSFPYVLKHGYGEKMLIWDNSLKILFFLKKRQPQSHRL